MPALETAHALAYVVRVAPRMRERAGDPRQPLGPRRQGRHRGGAAGGGGAMSGRIERAFTGRARRSAPRSSRTSPPAIPTRGAPSCWPGRSSARERTSSELGGLFTDPIADGPTNQRAAERALARGTTLSGVLGIVRELRYSSELPVVLFTYFNPVHAYGLARFAVDAGGGRGRRAVHGCARGRVRVGARGAAARWDRPRPSGGSDLDQNAHQGGAVARRELRSSSLPAPASPGCGSLWRKGWRSRSGWCAN